jgi:two-component system, NtrC family, response regulator GlrR
MPDKSSCLVVELGYRCPEELKSLVEAAGFHPIVGKVEDAQLEPWAFVLLVACAETQEGVRKSLETLTGRHGPQVMLVLEDPERLDLNALFTAGLADFICPPFSAAIVLPRIQRLARTDLGPSAKASHSLPAELGLLGKSPVFVAEMQKLPTISKCDVTVLIAGETGTGKEMVARAIHSLSDRRRQSFVPVDCGAIPQELAESELFGHEKGSFTGAGTKTTGLIGSANRGTLFLDEVDTLSLNTQAKLLRFLQRREYRAVGSTNLQQSNVRVISATNTDLREQVREGRFREDLFYRLKVVQMRLPPLRERGDDILLLAQHFVGKYASRFQRHARGIAKDGVARLLSHRWPGNIREVENVIEAAVALSEGEWLVARDIEFDSMDSITDSLREAKAQAVQDFERTYIVRLLRTYEGNISEAARAAKKNRRAFWELMRKYRVRAEEYRGDAARKGPGRESSSSTFTANC